MAFPTDPVLLSVLDDFGVGPADLLGYGGEAWVFALGHDRVLRLLHPGGRADDIVRRGDLVTELGRSQPPFALPHVLEIRETQGRVFAIEQRLIGRSVLDQLPFSTGGGRRQLIERYMEAAAALGDLALPRRITFGDLLHSDAITASTWHGYLAERAAANLARSTSEFWSVDPAPLADDLPDPPAPAFVHLDAFPGNMLTDGDRITAVIDIGTTSVAGDRRFDPLSAAVYLTSPAITPTATAADVDVAMSWLRAADLHQWVDPARRWLAAFWSFAVDDLGLLQWCREVLLDDR